MSEIIEWLNRVPSILLWSLSFYALLLSLHPRGLYVARWIWMRVKSVLDIPERLNTVEHRLSEHEKWHSN